MKQVKVCVASGEYTRSSFISIGLRLLMLERDKLPRRKLVRFILTPLFLLLLERLKDDVLVLGVVDRFKCAGARNRLLLLLLDTRSLPKTPVGRKWRCIAEVRLPWGSSRSVSVTV